MYKFINFKIFKVSLLFSFFINLFLFLITIYSKDFEMIISFGSFTLFAFVIIVFCFFNFKEIKTEGKNIILSDLYFKKEKTIQQTDLLKIIKNPFYIFLFTNIIYYQEYNSRKWFLFYGEIKE